MKIVPENRKFNPVNGSFGIGIKCQHNVKKIFLCVIGSRLYCKHSASTSKSGICCAA